MRLIDADAIPEKEMNYPVWVCLKKQPTIDAVPVVRCKGCKQVTWYEDYPGSYYPYCTRLCKETREDDFCSYGERKDGSK